MYQNTMANMAQAQAQELQQQQAFARQTTSGNYGLDHLGQKVNRGQRQSWNDRMTRFRQAGGPTTSQQMYDRIRGGQDQFGGNQQEGSGMPDLRGGIDNGVAAFGRLADQGLNSRYGATPIGRGVNNMLGRPMASRVDVNDGWNDSMNRGGVTGEGGWGMADDDANDTGNRGFY